MAPLHMLVEDIRQVDSSVVVAMEEVVVMVVEAAGAGWRVSHESHLPQPSQK
jgi:hypothetical protein